MATEKKNMGFSVLPRIINGGIAGIIGVTCVFPLDLVKTRLQNQQIGPNGERMYTSMFDCFRKIYATEGYFGMYRGSAVNILLITPEKGIKLSANDYFRYHLATPEGKLTLLMQCLAGGLAGAFQIIVTTPMELLKIQLQDAGRVGGQDLKKVTAWSITKQLVKDNGIFGLYKGVRATGARDITFSVIYFPLFAFLNDSGPRKPGTSGEAVFWWSLISGLLSGMTAAFSVTPLDVIKTRLQAIKKADGEKEFDGIFDCINKTLKYEGPKAFFKGGLCRMIVIAPLFGIAQMVYFMGIGERILGIEQKKSV
ncbi:mitochondrial glutamate carrier 1-like [Drosophila novamexicana]|uniref:mitochondrial glutamate carrier 1-like n=1 Tax=Drosophila novamexicana TaxID=47314 RepID=UPI0011E5CAAC|nr:mitochondrial glutamate carrier 1-like [Drosophila novamexicana]XP_030572207.1 mitochondrial glutamate carrier 1-like [Drosophila novamexicana]XP_030572208.1 mitochondrial glutamate carrier 1-like [Drosophila novamexicana]XP_030572209.1 mitochondrial glutamate carrier 1-like [Drosophila novamexicana]